MSPRAILALLLVEVAVAIAVLCGGVVAGRAAPIGWRVEVTACTPARCRVLPASAHRWGGREACLGRAARISQFADLTGLVPAGTTVTARCVALDGMPEA